MIRIRAMLPLCAASLSACAVPYLAPPATAPVLPIAERTVRVQVETVDGRERVRLSGFEIVEEPQARSVWCWAACATMILNWDGRSTTQDEVVERVKGFDDEGRLAVETASRYEVLTALAPDAPPTDFAAIWAELERLGNETVEQGLERIGSEEPESAEIEVEVDEDDALGRLSSALLTRRGVPVEDLVNGDPAVVALRDPDSRQGHLCVLVGATWRSDRGTIEAGAELLTEKFSGLLGRTDDWVRLDLDHIAIESVELFDPIVRDRPETKENESRIELSKADFDARVDFVLTRGDALRTLDRWSGLTEVEVQ